MYTGGIGKGDLAQALFAQSLAGHNLDLLFVGSGGRGEQSGISDSFALDVQAGKVIDYGGASFGNTASSTFQLAPFGRGLQNIGSDRTSTAWDKPENWSCNEAPGVNVIVLFSYGVPHYPIVNARTEIKRIQIDPGANVQVNSGQLLKLNVQ